MYKYSFAKTLNGIFHCLDKDFLAVILFLITF